MKKRLLCDIVSHYKQLYASQGEEVTVISTNGITVYIVEKSNGFRFPCKAEFLTDDEDVKVESKNVAPDTATNNKQITNRVPVSKTKRAAPINQPSLF